MVTFNHSKIILHDSTNFSNLPNVSTIPSNNSNDSIISGIDSKATATTVTKHVDSPQKKLLPANPKKVPPTSSPLMQTSKKDGKKDGKNDDANNDSYSTESDKDDVLYLVDCTEKEGSPASNTRNKQQRCTSSPSPEKYLQKSQSIFSQKIGMENNSTNSIIT
jgi:hypothetical protein